MAGKDIYPHDVPRCVVEYIEMVIRRMRYSRSARREVRQELIDHFSDSLAECPPEDREKCARELVAGFGDPRTLAALIRRGKKRCRPAWQKMLIRTGRGFLGLLVLFCLYVAWFAMGSPNPSVDYLAEFNRQTQPTPNESENAWPDYERAIQALKKPPNYIDKPRKPDDLPGIETQSWDRIIDPNRSLEDMEAYESDALRAWLDANDPSWS